jgi:hypothetical protein
MRVTSSECVMDEILSTDQHFWWTLSVTVTSLTKGTDPDDTKDPVNGSNAVTSQSTATRDPESARLLPISPDSIRSQGT